MTLRVLSEQACFGGTQRFYAHDSTACRTEMRFSVYLPPQSRAGRVLIALRDNEAGVQSFGIDVVKTRLAAFALSGFIAAFTGAFWICFGSLLRRQTAAIVIALVWLLVGEPLLGVAQVERYGPGHIVASIVEAGDQGSDLLAFGPVLAVALVYVAVAGGLGAAVLRRTDIT